MLLSPVPDQRQIGLLAALGVAGAAVFSVAVLPLLIPRVARAPQRTVIPLMRIASAFLTLRIRQGAFFLIAAALLLAASVFGLTRLEFDGDPRNLNLFLEERRQDEEQLRARWGDASPVSVVVRGETFEEALQANDRLNAALGAMRARGEIDSITSIASILPADLTQSTNQERWRAHWTPQRVDALRAAMEPSTRALGFTPDAFAPFFEWLTATPPSLDRSAFEGTPLGDLITSRVAHSGDAHLILTTFVPSRAEDVDALTARVRTVDPTVAVLAPDQFIDLAQDLAARELLLLALWSGIATTLALALFLRRPRLVLAALVPLMAGVVITLGLLGLLGIPVTMVSCLFIVFVFGVGIDYTIFMLTGLLASRRAGQSMNAQSHAAIAAGSVMLCGCTTLLGFTSLTVGSHPALFSIGTTGLLGIGANLACALVLVPALTGMAAGRAN
jgi:predicted exporter